MISKILKLSEAYLMDDSGATAVEYAIIIGLIAISVIAGATLIGQSVGGTLQDTSDTIGPVTP